MRTYSLYAAGLGLMFSSPKPLSGLKEGVNYSEDEDSRASVDELVRDQRLFLLATGSPQLDYVINVHDHGSGYDLEWKMRAFVSVGLDVYGGSIVVRDGYDLMDWNPVDEEAVVVPAEDGYYELLIGWVPSTRHAEMVLHIVARKAKDRIPGEEMYELIYEAAM